MQKLDAVDAASLRDDIPSFRAGDTLKVHVKVIEVDEKGKVSLDRIDNPEAPAGSGKPSDDHAERGDRKPRERRRPGDGGRRGHDDVNEGGERRQPRRHHEG